jgi:fibro-slime domain-containing protein
MQRDAFHPNPDTEERPPTRRRRVSRGIAVILALIAVGTAVVLALTLSSTGNQSALTSESLARTAKTRTAAAGGIDIATALVDQHGLAAFESRAEAAGDKPTLLFDTVTIGSVAYRGLVSDLEDAGAIHNQTIAVRLRVEATADETTQWSSAVGRLVQPSTLVRADLDLSEFGLLSTGGPGSIRIENGASAGAWTASPLSALHEPVLIGSSTLDADALELSGASARGFALIRNGTFPTTDDDYKALLADKVFRIPLDEIPVPHAPRPGRSGYALAVDLPDPPSDPEESHLADHRAKLVQCLYLPHDLPEPEFRTLDANRGNVNFVDENVALSSTNFFDVKVAPIQSDSGEVYPAESSGQWRQLDFAGNLHIGLCRLDVHVPTLLIVRGDLSLEQSTLVVSENASLAIVVFGKIELLRSTIGDTTAPIVAGPPPADPLDFATNYPVNGASKIVIYATRDPATPSPGIPSSIYFENCAIAAQIYAPTREIVFEGSKLFGRAVARDINFHGSEAGFFYDPALNQARGWSSPVSAVWKDGEARPELLAITELTDRGIAAAIESQLASVGGYEFSIDSFGNDIVVPLHAGYAGGSLQPFVADISETLAAVGTPSAVGNGTRLGAIVRDFRQAGDVDGNPDFHRGANGHDRAWVRAVGGALGGDGRPVFNDSAANPPAPKSVRYVTPANDEICWSLYDAALGDTVHGNPNSGSDREPITGAPNFATWFGSAAQASLSRPAVLDLVELSSNDFVLGLNGSDNPTKGTLFGQLSLIDDPLVAKDAYTVEMSLAFVRDESAPLPQRFSVTSGGDLWVFVNGALVAEIGSGEPGNSETTQVVPIERLGIADAAPCEIKIFYAHREPRPGNQTGFRFESNFAVTTTDGFLAGATYSSPDAAAALIDAARDHTRSLFNSGGLDAPKFADRGLSSWMRRLE